MSNSETQSLVNWAWSLVESGALTKSAFNRADAQCLADAHWLCGHGVDSSVIAQRMNTEPLSGSAGFKMERARIEEQIEEAKEKGPRRFGGRTGRKLSSGGGASSPKRYQPADVAER